MAFFKAGYALAFLSLSLVALQPDQGSAQASRPFWIAGHGGLGPALGENPYKGSLGYSARLSIGASPIHRLGVEAQALVMGGIGRGDYACVGGTLCPVFYSFRGAAGGFTLDLGPPVELRRIRLSAGVGWYRVEGDQLPGQPIPTVTSLGVHFGAEAAVWRLPPATIVLGVRSVLLTDVDGAGLWFIPGEIGIRF